MRLPRSHLPNQQEFTELLQPNLLPLNRFVFGMVGNQVEAEDIVQETVVKAFIHLPTSAASPNSRRGSSASP
jgi:DNA-directed RNA polymerase specialized sigma24 family protein